MSSRARDRSPARTAGWRGGRGWSGRWAGPDSPRAAPPIDPIGDTAAGGAAPDRARSRARWWRRCRARGSGSRPRRSPGGAGGPGWRTGDRERAPPPRSHSTPRAPLRGSGRRFPPAGGPPRAPRRAPRPDARLPPGRATRGSEALRRGRSRSGAGPGTSGASAGRRAWVRSDQGGGRPRGPERCERGDPGGELLPPRPGELVVAGAAPGRRHPPFGLDPPLELETLEGGVEGAFLDPERVAGEPPDVLGDAVAVQGPEREGLEEQEVEGAGKEVDLEGIPRRSHRLQIHRCAMGSEPIRARAPRQACAPAAPAARAPAAPSPAMFSCAVGPEPGASMTDVRSEEHTSELQSHSFISYAVFCLKKKKT